ncbi:MAG: hypothetical protein OXF88_06785 [Rhodobacteraceae bacterium]|nr:hypothetical protein [Paracoccaceae bacterium]MCY4137914.1 hypothetical protein [Paracoccaceae bacterium]
MTIELGNPFAGDPEFGTALETGAAAGFGPDQGASRGLECRDPGLGVLIRRRDPGIADAGGRTVHFGYASGVW